MNKQSKKLIGSKEKVEFVIDGFEKEIGFYIDEDNRFKCLFYVTLLFGVGAYYEYFMKDRVMRYELDIFK